MPRLRKEKTSRQADIGARVAAIRKRQALTQVELARKLGMSQSLLSRYERGVLRLHGTLIIDVAKVLQTSADEILGLKESKGNGLFTDRRFVRRLQKLERLPKRKKAALLTTLDSFLKGAHTP